MPFSSLSFLTSPPQSYKPGKTPKKKAPPPLECFQPTLHLSPVPTLDRGRRPTPTQQHPSREPRAGTRQQHGPAPSRVERPARPGNHLYPPGHLPYTHPPQPAYPIPQPPVGDRTCQHPIDLPCTRPGQRSQAAYPTPHPPTQVAATCPGLPRLPTNLPYT